ncbi:unnamed protein product [Gordionus sp. m RMFG-2023]|uniref:equilibrative nucleoside transporter 3-like isoform X2 n=1 Tax=Gordionus sp. m RMFG-2023 TaxID=3053472 RepID=UPI0030DE6FE9
MECVHQRKFDYKLNPNVTGTHEYKENFISYLGVISQLPNVILMALNLFVQFGSSTKNINPKAYQTQPRIPISIIINVMMCIVTVILAILDTSTWPKAFFILTMITAAITNSAAGIYQSSIFGLAGSLPMKYTNGVIIGNNVCGTLFAVVYILAIYASPNLRLSAIWYFISAQFVLLACFDSYFALPLLKFYRYHLRTLVKSEQTDGDVQDTSRKYKLNDYYSVFTKIWIQCFGVFFCVFVTFTIYPTLLVKIEKKDPNFFISDKYFQAIIIFLNYNFFSLVGNLVTEKFKKPGPKSVWLPILMRVFFIPLFLFCNYHPDIRKVPVLIKYDFVYAMLSILLAASHGYFLSLTMMYAPSLVEPRMAQLAGMMATLFMIIGLLCGLNFALLVSKLF